MPLALLFDDGAGGTTPALAAAGLRRYVSRVMASSALVQILLPLNDNEQESYPPALFAQVRQELVDRFGGVTVQLAAPAQGVWRDEGAVVLDSIVTFEVMVDDVDHAWWAEYRRLLEQRFRQQEVVVRALAIARL